MFTVKFDSGQTVNFTSQPTQKDIDEVAAKLKVSVSSEPENTEGDTGAKGFATGIAQGEVKTAKGIQALGNSILSPVKKLFGLEGVKTGFSSLDSETSIGKRVDKAITPKTSSEKVGFLTEKIVESAVPFSKVSKVASVGSAATKAATFAKTGSNILSKVAGLGTRVGVEAAGGLGITGVQEGSLNNNARDSAIISAAFPVAGAVLRQGKTLTEDLVKQLPSRIVNSLIKPLQKDFAYGKNPGRAVAEEGIVAKDLDELAVKISKKKMDVGDQIGIALSTPEAMAIKLDVSDSIKPIDDAIIQAQKSPRTNAALITRLQNAKDDLLGANVGSDGSVTYSKNLVDITPLEATGVKRDVGDITKFTGNASDDNIVNSALRKVYGSIKSQIDTAVPSIKPLNERYADLISAEVATKYRDKIFQRQNLISIGEKGIGTGTALLTALSTGGAALPSILVGFGAAGVAKIAGSPGFKTRVAAYLAKATPQQKKQLFEKVPWFKSIVINTLNN